MEQQKLLWIVFALATGFLVVVAAAFILFVPPAETPIAGQGAAAIDKDVFDVTDYLKNGETPLELEEEKTPEEDASFVIGIADDEAPLVSPAEAPEVKTVESEAVITQDEPKPAARTSEVRRTPEPAPVKPAPVKKVTVTEYWIQAGSFTQRASAERARESLKEKEFDSVIFTRSINGIDYFRVRIGPYRHKAEAEKFLSYVKNISSFEGSQIFEVYVEKTL